VVLVDPGGPPALGLLLATKDAELDLRGAVFRADRDEVRVADGGDETLVLEKTFANGISVRRVYRFRSGSYRIDVEQTIARAEGAPETFAYRLLWEPGIAFTEHSVDEERREMAAVTALGDKVVRDPASKIKEQEPVERTGGVRFAALKSKYFALAILPEDGSGADVWIRRLPGEERVSLDIKLPLRDPSRNASTFGLYAGPLDLDILKREGGGLESMVDLGWTWIRPISRYTLAFMNFVYRFVPNYGVVIFLVSLITKLLFYKLTAKSLKSMKDMQRIQGQVTALREKFKNDAARLNKETMALYKREGVNPLSGCLPMLLQMPVFIALYQVLQRTIELRRAPFVLWVDDLSRPDVLATFPASLPFLGPYLSLLPLLMGATMFVQQKMTTVDPRQKAMIYMMPVLFTVLFYRLPSGLVLYWLVNNVLSIGQQYLMDRGGRRSAGAQVAAGGEDPGTRSNKQAKGRGRNGTPLAKETK
jgi:YidC/Oxa1 family membrane protein insertase